MGSKYRNLHLKTVFFIFIAFVAIVSLYLFSKSPTKQLEPNIHFNVLKKPDNVQQANIISKEKTVKITVKKGDSLGSIFGGLRVDNSEIYASLNSLSKIFNSSKLKVGDRVIVHYKEISYISGKFKEIKLTKVRIITNKGKEYLIYQSKNGNGYAAKKVNVKSYIKTKAVTFNVENSLYIDAIEENVPVEIVMEFIRLYSFDIDFQRDIHKGDKFTILFEEFYNENNEFLKAGDIIYTEYKARKRQLRSYKYKAGNRKALYYDTQGDSIIKSLLRTPINGARISSGFGYRRHPVLGYTKLHKGVDFAAPRGTPIFSSGSGKITYRGWKGAYGNFIQIRHNSRYSTAYAHMSRFARGLKKGSRVRQGQVIGYVGTTGRSTGAHLHYEVRSRGKQVNPRRVKSQPKVMLKREEYKKFVKHRQNIDFIVNSAFSTEKKMPTVKKQ